MHDGGCKAEVGEDVRVGRAVSVSAICVGKSIGRGVKVCIRIGGSRARSGEATGLTVPPPVCEFGRSCEGVPQPARNAIKTNQK